MVSVEQACFRSSYRSSGGSYDGFAFQRQLFSIALTSKLVACCCLLCGLAILPPLLADCCCAVRACALA
jgi:hypothetical protein